MAQSAIHNNFNVIQRIGCGFSADVQLLQQKISGQLFALKLYKAKQSILYENEKQIMEELSDCPGVIQIESQSLQFNQQGEPFKYILMEYAQEGNMWDFMQNRPLPLPIARAYFRQLLTILEQIHKRGIVHRDIKLENLLLDENFRLKICDFGFAAKYMDLNGQKILMKEHVGTMQTAAPELYEANPYSGVEADLFQMGVILFQICTSSIPFKSANAREDQLYQLISKNQISKFWTFHENRLGRTFFPKELKDLIQKLLANNPNQRLSIEEIYNHSWMQQDDADTHSIFEEMKSRRINHPSRKISD